MHNPVHRVRGPQPKQRRSGASLDGQFHHVARAHTRDTSGTRRTVDIVPAVVAALDARLAELSVHPLARLAREPFAIRLTHGGVARPLTLPLVTLTQRNDPAVVLPVAGNTHERTAVNRARCTAERPLDTVHGTLDRAIVISPMGGVEPRPAKAAPAPTQTTTTRAALVVPARGRRVPQQRAERPWRSP